MSLYEIRGSISEDTFIATTGANPTGWLRVYVYTSLYSSNKDYYKVDVTLKWFFGNSDGLSSSKYIDTSIYGWTWRINIRNNIGQESTINFYWRPTTSNGSYGKIYGTQEYDYTGTAYIHRGACSTGQSEYLTYEEEVLHNPNAAGASFIGDTWSGTFPTGYNGMYQYKRLVVSSPTASSIPMILHNGSFSVRTEACKEIATNESHSLVATMNGKTKILYSDSGPENYTETSVLYGADYNLRSGKEYILSLQRKGLHAEFDSPKVNRTYRTYSEPNIDFSLDSWYNADEIIKFSVNNWRGVFGTENSNCTIYASNGSSSIVVANLSNNITKYNASVLDMGSSVTKMFEKLESKQVTFKIYRFSELNIVNKSVNTTIHFRPSNAPNYLYGYVVQSNGAVQNKSLSTTITTDTNVYVPVTYTGNGYVDGYQVFVRESNNSSAISNFSISATNVRNNNFKTNIRINANLMKSTRIYSLDIRPYYTYKTNGSRGYGSNYTINNAIHYLVASSKDAEYVTMSSDGVWIGKNMLLYFQLPKDSSYLSLTATKMQNYRYQDVIVKITTQNNTLYTYRYSKYPQYFSDATDGLTYLNRLYFNVGLTNIPNETIIKKCQISVVYSADTDGTTYEFKVYNNNDTTNITGTNKKLTYVDTVNTLQKFINFESGTIIKGADVSDLFCILYNMLKFIRDTIAFQSYYALNSNRTAYVYYSYDANNVTESFNGITCSKSVFNDILMYINVFASVKYDYAIRAHNITYASFMEYLYSYIYIIVQNTPNREFINDYMSEYFSVSNNTITSPDDLKKYQEISIITANEFKIIAKCLMNIVTGL